MSSMTPTIPAPRIAPIGEQSMPPVVATPPITEAAIDGRTQVSPIEGLCSPQPRDHQSSAERSERAGDHKDEKPGCG